MKTTIKVPERGGRVKGLANKRIVPYEIGTRSGCLIIFRLSLDELLSPFPPVVIC